MNINELPNSFDKSYYIADYIHINFKFPFKNTILDFIKKFNISFNFTYKHFITKGKTMGIMGSPLCDRNNFIRWLNNYNFKKILEIGPGVNPSFSGENVSYFDVRKGSEFYKYAEEKGVKNFYNLPKINFHEKNGSLKNINEKFNLAFSSHCIEHTYDIIEHINDVEHILSCDGLYCLIIPDKRYCFDHYRELSTIGNIIYKHFRNDINSHTLSVFIDSLIRTHNNCKEHWRKQNGLYPNISSENINSTINNYNNTNDENLGLHAWTFTDESFKNIFTTLYKSGITKLYPNRVFNTPKNSNCFCAIMTRHITQ